MNRPCLVIVDSDVLVRHPLAQYLRECGYQVIEAFDPAEARQIFEDGATPVDVVLVDIDTAGDDCFSLASWLRASHPGVEVVLAGTVAKTVERAGDLCREGPAVPKPYDHQGVLDHIKRMLAARDRFGG
jgi:DNA-binding NtrC family response regulator